jgi:hypothetical protein
MLQGSTRRPRIMLLLVKSNTVGTGNLKSPKQIKFTGHRIFAISSSISSLRFSGIDVHPKCRLRSTIHFLKVNTGSRLRGVFSFAFSRCRISFTAVVQRDVYRRETQDRFQNIRSLLRVNDPDARAHIPSRVIISSVKKLVACQRVTVSSLFIKKKERRGQS